MRAFIAIEIPAEIKNQLAACGNQLKRLPVEASWTKRAGLHLTLKFLGEVPESSQALIAKAMQKAAAGVAPFRLELQGLGGFPNLNRPRVLWVGLAGQAAAAQKLQQDLELKLEAAGFPREEKAFKPHLTLARIKQVEDPKRFAAGVTACPVPPASFEVDRIVLYRSELHPTGARYTELAEASLGPPALPR